MQMSQGSCLWLNPGLWVGLNWMNGAYILAGEYELSISLSQIQHSSQWFDKGSVSTTHGGTGKEWRISISGIAILENRLVFIYFFSQSTSVNSGICTLFGSSKQLQMNNRFERWLHNLVSGTSKLSVSFVKKRIAVYVFPWRRVSAIQYNPIPEDTFLYPIMVFARGHEWFTVFPKTISVA